VTKILRLKTLAQRLKRRNKQMNNVEQINEEMLYRTGALAEKIDELEQRLETSDRIIRLLVLSLASESFSEASLNELESDES